MNIAPSDVRGIGIHVTKLSTPGHSAVLPVQASLMPNQGNRPRQVTLSPMVKKEARPPPLQSLPKPLLVEDSSEVIAEEEEGHLVLPPADQVDVEVYDALPQHLREEMERTYGKRKQEQQRELQVVKVRGECVFLGEKKKSHFILDKENHTTNHHNHYCCS